MFGLKDSIIVGWVYEYLKISSGSKVLPHKKKKVENI